MKKFKYILFVLFCFIPFYKVDAASSYSVEMVSGNSNNQLVGTYSNYHDALNVMNNQNSSNTRVASIFKDGVIIDSKYAIFKFKPGSVYNLYRDSNSSSPYTSVHGSYGTDAALLGYSDNGRVKIMISGFIGWTSINNGVITPISLMSANMINVNGSGVRLRSEPNLNSSVVGKISGSHNFNYTETYNGSDYTWYKINYNGSSAWVAGASWVNKYDSSLGTYYLNYSRTGNLIHHFTTYGGIDYTDSFSNLGTAPSYLENDKFYYSFDGNYFYSNLPSMLEDYRSGSYGRSVNSNNPHYSYYMYLTARSTTGYSSSDLDNIVINSGYDSSSKMYGTGAYFKEAEEKYGTNALLAFSAAINESNWGTSSIARDKNNLFGYGAADSCPYDCAYTYSSPKDSIMSYASASAGSYEALGGQYYFGSHYGNKSSGKNIRYATDPYWGEKMAGNAFIRDKNFGGKDFNSNTIGVTKKGVNGVWVFSSPKQTDENHIYTLKSNGSDPVYDFSANIVDKVEVDGKSFYKIYTDLSNRDPLFGYVWADEWNVSNNQPVINASDLTVKVGDSFNYLDGVSAYDIENGDLTGRISYDGVVDTSKAGDYTVTYSTFDNSNFHVSKKVKVKVIDDDVITIEASDKEVTQFDNFDYLDGVRAYDKNGDLTDKIKYEGIVDTSKVGDYEITYKVKNSNGKEEEKKVKIKVIKNEKPVIDAKDKETSEGKEVNLLDEVTAVDKEDGDLTEKITYDGNVDFNKIGEYKVTYSVVDRHSQKASKTITVKVVKDQAPTINANDRSIVLNSKFDPLDGVSAFDKEDGDLTDKVKYEGEVDTSKEGEYSLKYVVSDSKMHKAEKSVKIKVSKKVLKEANGRFDLEYFTYVNDNLKIKGFSTIDGIDNNLNTPITYSIEFVNIETNEKILQDLDRINEKSNIPYETPSNDGKDYSYAWFEGTIDVGKLKQGDYEMNIIASSDDYFSKTVVNNQLFSNQVSSRKDKSGKYILTNIDYFDDNAPLQLIVRDEKLADKTTDATSTQYGQFEELKIKDNKLHLFGNSFSYGSNLSSDVDVKRNIIFENVKTLKKYVFDLGSVENGLYDVKMPVNDHLGKNKAWYNNDIDISNLDKGKYVIYINTISNVSDISLLNDQMFTKFDDDSFINNKKYSFKVNYNKQYRVELTVE